MGDFLVSFLPGPLVRPLPHLNYSSPVAVAAIIFRGLNSGRDGQRPEDPSREGGPCPESTREEVPTRAPTPSSTWSFLAGARPKAAACVGSGQWTPTGHRAGPFAMDQGTVSVAQDHGGPVLTVWEPGGMMPSG